MSGAGVGVGLGVGDGCTVGVGVGDELVTVGLAVGCGRSVGVDAPALILSFEKMKYARALIETNAITIDATAIGTRNDLRPSVTVDGGGACMGGGACPDGGVHSCAVCI